MARLSDEAIAKGEKTAVEINGDQATLYMTEDFKYPYRVITRKEEIEGSQAIGFIVGLILFTPIMLVHKRKVIWPLPTIFLKRFGVE